jgi:hypothetical protein
MPLTCVKCRRANPSDAVYCYHDGFALDGHARGAGPVAVGSQQFPSPFVFPNGRTCRSFDELAIACQEDWDAAKELLAQGFFGSFFGGMGRADLARAANEAAKFGDPVRGLDQLLDKLPSQVLQEPKLRAEPQEISLGTLPAGTDRDIELHLENQGMRLLYGKVMSVNTPWLSLGAGKGVAEKLFEFTHETTVTVHVRGAKLRASNKPQEGKLVIDSNGGNPVTIRVRCDVPVKPFPGSGPLAGARSPRQVAEKAKANPREAAKVFEAGEVQNWYKANGWDYPVQGPTASGLSAIQQFFEALGLTPAPKVAINHRSVALSGEPGQQNVTFTLEVKTDEKKPVYAHGKSNQPWLEVGRAKLNGRVATISLTVPSVPDRPGETLTAKVAVQANGNQRFVIPVTLQIGNSLDFTGAPVVLLDEAPAPSPVKSRPAVMPAVPLDFTAAEAAPEALPEPVITPRVRRGGNGPHWLAAALLAVCLFILVLLDLLRKEDTPPKPRAPQVTETNWKDYIKSSKPSLTVLFTEQSPKGANDPCRFGLTTKEFRDPNNENKEKRLTFDEYGGTNNTVIKIDGYEYIFGRTSYAQVKLRPANKQDEQIRDRYWTRTCVYGQHGVEVTQHVLLVPGPKKTDDEKEVPPLENCLVYYEVKNVNQGNVKRHVGVRVLLDTFIGGNDGVPFTIPKHDGFMDTSIDLRGKDVPEFIEAVENPGDKKDPGTVARFGLKGIKVPWVPRIDEPTRLVVCQQPANPQVKWNWGDPGSKEGEFHPINASGKSDSCVVMYWDEVALDREEGRFVGFTYGLNSLKIEGIEEGAGTGLALSLPPGVLSNKEFTVTCYVYNARAGQEVTLKLPKGLELSGDDKGKETKAVTKPGDRVKVEWRVKGTQLGVFEITAESGKATSKKKATVRDDGIF